MLDEIKQKIEDELVRLQHELTVTLPIAIRKAVELGDLRENADYKSALERQQFVQARMGHLTQRLAELSKIDLSNIPADRVGFGSKVRLEDTATGNEVQYTIVAPDFMDLDAGQISMYSPVGRALMGHREGEEVTVQLPAGARQYKLLEVVTLPQMVED